MTRSGSVDERISEWLLAEAPDQLPDRVLEATFARIRATPRPRVLFGGRVFPMPRQNQRAIAVGAAAIVVLAVGAVLLPRWIPGIGNSSSPTPGNVSPSAAPSTTSTSSAGPTLVPVSLTGQIAFERTVDGNTDIYLMNLDRSGLIRLTSDPAVDSKPSWSPDGTKIVFTRGSGPGRDVFVMNADGSAVTQLTTSVEGEDSAAFSPDATQIAFSRYVDPSLFDLYVMAADGSNARLVFHKDGAFTCCPAWTHDGKSLLFADDETGGQIDLLQLDLASGKITPIAAGPGDDSGFALSPDGSTIVFQSDREPGGLFLMNADGSDVRHLTGTWLKGAGESWAPDGSHIIYQPPLEQRMYLIGTDGTEPILWAFGASPVWRPAP